MIKGIPNYLNENHAHHHSNSKFVFWFLQLCMPLLPDRKRAVDGGTDENTVHVTNSSQLKRFYDGQDTTVESLYLELGNLEKLSISNRFPFPLVFL